LGYQKLILDFTNDPTRYSNIDANKLIDMLSGFQVMYLWYSISLIEGYNPECKNVGDFMGLSEKGIESIQNAFGIQLSDLKLKKDYSFIAFGKFLDKTFQVIHTHYGENVTRPSKSISLFTEKNSPFIDVAKLSENFKKSFSNDFYQTENTDWMGAIKKYQKLQSEYQQFESRLRDFVEKEGMKNGGVFSIENSIKCTQMMDGQKSLVKLFGTILRKFLFDVPVLLYSLMTRQVVSNAEGIFSYDSDVVKAVATPFSALTTPVLPYTSANLTREMWFEAAKCIKKALSENDYKEIQNLSSKIRTSIELPKNFEFSWP